MKKIKKILDTIFRFGVSLNETKRNETKRNETKRNETKRNEQQYAQKWEGGAVI